MTLSSFLKDYVYIPLGGNRKGNVSRHINIMITMLLGGLWHGAGWTFIIWGGLHGLFIVLNHLYRSIFVYELTSIYSRFMARCTTFFAVSFAWIFFRADSLISQSDEGSGPSDSNPDWSFLENNQS